MGNEHSQLSGLVIDEKAAEVTDFWIHYQATINESCHYFNLKSDCAVSVFKGETAVLGPLWTLTSPLEKFSNNLIKYRHPCIIKYLSAWQQRSTFHLATEYVQPLSQVLSKLTPLQICIGLNNILRALVFLHEQAGMSHNNLSISAVYITGDGQWKLGGLQFLYPLTELTAAYLKQARIHRYDKAIDPNESSYDDYTKVDQYGFAVLVDDVFEGRKEDQVPFLKEFKVYCKQCLQHSIPSNRPSLSEVLQHDFFNHDFISIYKFLNFLPLKTDKEKRQFFRNILESLKHFEEETVAEQFSSLLLSRVTVLDGTAQKHVLPQIFTPKNGRPTDDTNEGFFSLSVFKEHVKPRLIKLFTVRDIQIRMLLLKHFTRYVHVFTHDELSQHILPELLLGIKDNDDNLVASTLICLSELVPILGGDTVIGGKRSKLFADGRPKTNDARKLHEDTYLTSKSLQDFRCSEVIYDTSAEKVVLNERLPPVGGESVDYEKSVKDSNSLEHSEDEWSDWDNSNRRLTIWDTPDNIKEETVVTHNGLDENVINIKNNDELLTKSKSTLLLKAALEAKKNIVDISELDIKSQKNNNSKKKTDDVDFFVDMEPVIEKATVVNVMDNTESDSKLNFVPDENTTWGENWDE